MKRLLSILLIAATLLSLFAIGVSAAGVTVEILGSPIPYDSGSGTPYVSDSGILMVPVERTAEYLGVGVTEDSATGDTLLQLGTRELRLRTGKADFVVNGMNLSLPAPVVESAGVLYVPAKELVTALGGYYTESDGVLGIDPQSMDYMMVQYEKAPQSLGAKEFWDVWAEANQLRNEGKYSEAIPKFVSVIPGFTRPDSGSKNDNSAALAFGRMAECMARVGEYDLAAAAYSRSAYYYGLMGDGNIQLARSEHARSCRTELSLYLHTDDLSLCREETHDVPYEPQRGVVLGYTSTRLGSSDTYPTTSAKAAGMQLIYFNWDSDNVADKLSAAAPDKVVELGVQPINGFSAVSDAEIIAFAQALAASGRKIMVRYANEMNNTDTIPWSAEPEVYRAEFIRFAKLLRQYAPGVPLIWAPNFFPTDNVESFYPGDEYVDYVGVSSYVSSYTWTAAEKAYEYDVFGDGVKTTRWAQQLDFFYNRYGYKKPLLISEGAASYVDAGNGFAEAADQAAEQLREFYTYFPMRYPNMKYAVYYNADDPYTNTKYMLSSRQQLKDAYNAAIADEQFLSSYSAEPDTCYVPFESIFEAEELPNTEQELCAFVRYGTNSQVKSVRYEINGNVEGTLSEAPYRLNVDFSKYGGRTVTIKLTALDGSGNALSSKRFQVRVHGKTGFRDVPDDAWYANPVLWAVENGITKGIDDTHFGPGNPCTREQVVTFLWAAFDREEPTSTENPFSDVGSGEWYFKPVLWAKEKGITSGVGEDLFGVGQSCTRAQVVTFLWAAAGKPAPTSSTNPFTDVSENDYFYKAVLWAAENGITKGVDETHFGPNSTCTRAEVVTFLYKASMIFFPAAQAE